MAGVILSPGGTATGLAVNQYLMKNFGMSKNNDIVKTIGLATNPVRLGEKMYKETGNFIENVITLDLF